MTTHEDAIFERIRETWPNVYVHFFMVYRCAKTDSGLDLEWIKASSSSSLTKKHYDKIAADFHEIALQSYLQNRDFIMRENSPDKDSGGCKPKNLYGFTISEKPNPLPANSLGQRWWQFVIGSGAVRNAGFVLIARLAAVDSKEVRKHIDRIQSIIRDKK